VVGDSPENEEFYNATPYGEIRMGIVNPTTLARFEEGDEFYVDFTKVE